MTPYHQLASDYARLLKQGRSFPLGTFKPTPRPEIPPNAPKALCFAPHPDDECITLVMKAKPLFLFMHLLFQKVAEFPPKEGTAKQLAYSPPAEL